MILITSLSLTQVYLKPSINSKSLDGRFKTLFSSEIYRRLKNINQNKIQNEDDTKGNLAFDD